MLDFHNDPTVIQKNVLPPRAYAIPFSQKEACTGKRESSDRFLLLNGTWAFDWFPAADTVDSSLLFAPRRDTMPVPGMWQTNGYDEAAYVSSPYPFLYRPPFVPKKNPVGLYRTAFTVRKQAGKRYELVFEGADSCLYLYINRQFVGYGEISHCTKIFDVTDFICDGENQLDACVVKFCTGSYLEDQDKLRMTGIFRDVYLLTRDEEYVQDVHIQTYLADDHTSARVTVSLTGVANALLTFTGPDGATLDEKPFAGEAITFTVDAPCLWSAETPVLYGVTVHAGGEYLYFPCGIRSVKTEKGVFLFNGKPIKLKGVNRHDSHPDKGYAVSEEDMLRDLTMMKAYHINCVRTSHYPNDPRFYRMCDELGIYVCAEADIETHGCGYISAEAFRTLNHDPQYEFLFVDRMARMVESVKNSPCIVMYSLGNESLWGQNFAACSRYIKAKDPRNLVHYESCFRTEELEEESRPFVDFYSHMYPAIGNEKTDYRMQSYPADDTRPYFMCEYSHAMGNSCGDLFDYWQKIYSDDRLCGGCVWEWCDHALRRTDAFGNVILAYGGELEDRALHSENICCDGLVSPDREPHSALDELKQVYAPLYAEVNENALTVTNRYDFVTPADLRLVWRVEHNGKLILQEELPFTALPGQKQTFPLPAYPQKGENVLLVEALRGTESLYRAGFSLASEAETAEPASGTLSVVQNDGLHICGEGFAYTFSLAEPAVTHIRYGKNEILRSPMAFSLWRAPLDNDRPVRNNWSNGGRICVEGNLRYPLTDCETPTVEKASGRVTVSYPVFVGCMGKKPIFEGKLTYTVFGNGTLHISLRGDIRSLQIYLPRFGLKWNFDPSLQNVAYFGYGPGESYIDKHHACYPGVFTSTVRQMFREYSKPQENGSVWQTKWATLTDEAGQGITLAGSGFSFNASVFDEGTLADASHSCYLVPEDTIVVHTDWFLSGVGSSSCGPELMQKYRTPTGKVDFSLALSPMADGFQKLAEYNYYGKEKQV